MPATLLDLLQKYDVPTPRYTSYPTVPYWDSNTINAAIWKNAVIGRFKKENGKMAIYIHLPFCENLCTFCACNKRITKNHAVEDPYISAVLKEWKMYLSVFPAKPVIQEIHLGGGTPTFFSPENLERLVAGIIEGCEVDANHAFSVEVHPNYTTEAHIKKLAELGFNRISVGVQDFDEKVQFAINRRQTFEKTKQSIEWARKYHFSSVNIDLVYGLPYQSVENVAYSIACIQELLPTRIAFYSYAHVPWKSKVQRRYSEADLPNAHQKWEMYHNGKKLLEKSGFQSIGMDHFALRNDTLFEAAADGTLYRNFMGYTTSTSKLLIGLGVSSISDSWDAFIQNEKVVESYESKIAAGEWPIVHGHKLNEEDMFIRKLILELMCCGVTTIDDTLESVFLKEALEKLKGLEGDGLIEIWDKTIKVTEAGKSFIRNIAAAIDAKQWRETLTEITFSKAI